MSPQDYLQSENSLNQNLNDNDPVDASQNTLIVNTRACPSLLDIKNAGGVAVSDSKSNGKANKQDDPKIPQRTTSLKPEKRHSNDGSEEDDEANGFVDRLVRYIQVQSNTKAWPSRLGNVSRTQFLLLIVFAAVWLNNQVQLMITLMNDIDLNGHILDRTWFSPELSSADWLDELTILVFLSAYVKELIRVSVLGYLLINRKINKSSKWFYAFVSYSGFMLPVILVSPYHAKSIVESRTFDAIFEPQVVLLDLLTIDLPLGTRAIRGFFMGRTRNNLILSIWTTLSVTSKGTRFLWRVLLMIHRHQLISRARLGRTNALTEWTKGIQDAIGVCGHQGAVSAFIKHVPHASKSSGGASDGTARVFAYFKRTMAYVLEITCLVGFLTVWRMLESTWSTSVINLSSSLSPRLGLATSSKELRDTAALIKSGKFKIGREIKALINQSDTHLSNATVNSHSVIKLRSKKTTARSAKNLSSNDSFTSSSRNLGSEQELKKVDPNSPEYELSEVILRHARALAYLERTPILDILVTDDFVAMIKAIWSTKAMQMLVLQLSENPHLWQDRIMSAWPRILEQTPSPKECIAMIPFQMKFVTFCLERSERFLRRLRPQISDIDQMPHSLSELVLCETFQSLAVRLSTRQKFAFSLYRLPLQIQTHSQKLLVLSQMFVACFDLEEFDQEIEVLNKRTTKFLNTLSELDSTLPSPDNNGHHVILCCMGVLEFQNRLPILIQSAMVRHHYPNFVRKVNETTSPEVAWTKFKVYLQRVLTKICPDVNTVVVTDELGMDACVMAVLNDIEAHAQQELLNTANLVG